MNIAGQCPCCGQDVSCAWTEYKRNSICPHCEEKMFISIDKKLKGTNWLIFIALLIGFSGGVLRVNLPPWQSVCIMFLGAFLVLTSYAIEACLCNRVLNSK